MTIIRSLRWEIVLLDTQKQRRTKHPTPEGRSNALSLFQPLVTVVLPLYLLLHVITFYSRSVF